MMLPFDKYLKTFAANVWAAYAYFKGFLLEKGEGGREKGTPGSLSGEWFLPFPLLP